MDDITSKVLRDVLVKRPWWEYTPTLYRTDSDSERRDDNRYIVMPEDHNYRKVKTQADFLREYYPTAHKIFDPVAYPNAKKFDPDSKKWYEQPMSRTAFAFQQLIAVKHTLHLTGNDVQFEIADGYNDSKDDEQMQEMLIKFKKTWLTSSMEMSVFDAINAWNIVADAATICFFDEKGKFGARTFSYMNGDTLYPHFNSVTGKLELFARKYYDYDENGAESAAWVEVWDDTYIYTFCHKQDPKKPAKDTFYELPYGYCINGYYLFSKQRHGFQTIPVAYIRRNGGPCWAMVQKNIEDYEEAFSYLCENNKAYGFPIFYAKGDGDEIAIGGDMHGAAKYVQMNDKDADAGFLNGTDASNAFATQLDKSYDLIYELSFTVKPPQLKSGDLPGVALKLLYSPAIECAMNDAQSLQPYIEKLTELVKYGTGYELSKIAEYMSLPINCWIQAFVFANQTELVTNLATAVQNGFLSHQTASERCPDFPKTDEYSRIVRETKEKQEQDLLKDIQLQDAQTENNIEQQEAQARINRERSGNDVNTGHGGTAGRPNRSGKVWDKNGNFLGENNWKDFNKLKGLM